MGGGGMLQDFELQQIEMQGTMIAPLKFAVEIDPLG